MVTTFPFARPKRHPPVSHPSRRVLQNSSLAIDSSATSVITMTGSERDLLDAYDSKQSVIAARRLRK